MAETKTPLAFLVQLEDEFGQPRLKAYVMRPQTNGELWNVQWDGGWCKDGAEYDGFVVSAYVGDRMAEYDKGVWGLRHDYAPHRIDSAKHAATIARVFAKVDRGLNKAHETDGYLADGDYAGYLLRVSRVLRIPAIHVRNSASVREMSGDRYRKVNGAGLQYWVEDVARAVKDGKHHDYIRA